MRRRPGGTKRTSRARARSAGGPRRSPLRRAVPTSAAAGAHTKHVSDKRRGFVASQLPSGSCPWRVLVTAGPTREHVDPVRFLSNESSGRMGFAIAAAAARAGHAVTLIAGPVSLSTPRGVRRLDVVSARELLAVARREFRRCDALFMSAAVADWRPARRLAGKWRRKDQDTGRAVLELVRNPDVLATLTRAKGERLVVGFALETGAGLRRARRKLATKRLDFVVLNGPLALNAARTSVIILASDGSTRTIANESKEQVARTLVGLLSTRARPAR